MQTRSALDEMLQGLQRLKASQTVALPPAAPAAVQGVSRLLLALREFAGFRATSHLQRKLEKVFQGISPLQLEQWIDRLVGDSSGRELTALVEDLTNHETYFFRDTPQLDVLAQHVLPQLVAAKAQSRDKTIRIWSAACSTGEEAWTLALMTLQALLDAGIAREMRPGEIWLPPDWRLEVLGTDISRQAIRLANAGAYRTELLASFRQFPESYLRFFEATAPAAAGQPGYRQVRASLRRHVRFELFNLMQAQAPAQQQDLVLCRNVLIYLDPAAHAGVQRMLGRALRPGGFLMLGVVDRLLPREQFTDRWFSRCVINERH